MCNQIEPGYEKKLLEELRPAEINAILDEAAKTGLIEIDLETDLEIGSHE